MECVVQNWNHTTTFLYIFQYRRCQTLFVCHLISAVTVRWRVRVKRAEAVRRCWRRVEEMWRELRSSHNHFRWDRRNLQAERLHGKWEYCLAVSVFASALPTLQAGSSSVHDTVVNQLLSKMDGVEQLNNILVIGGLALRIALVSLKKKLWWVLRHDEQEGHDRRGAA